MQNSVLPYKQRRTLDQPPPISTVGETKRSTWRASFAAVQPLFDTPWTPVQASALLQGRYAWRRNSVLSAVKHGIEAFWALPATQEVVKATIAASKSRLIKFVRPGYDSSSNTAVSRRPLSSESILLQADDWQFLFDLGPEQLLFPPEVATTTLLPDGVFYSLSTKPVILLTRGPCSCGPWSKEIKINTKNYWK